MRTRRKRYAIRMDALTGHQQETWGVGALSSLTRFRPRASRPSPTLVRACDMPAGRIMPFIVSPRITNMPNTTANAQRRMRSRYGNGDPSGRVWGIANASAPGKGRQKALKRYRLLIGQRPCGSTDKLLAAQDKVAVIREPVDRQFNEASHSFRHCCPAAIVDIQTVVVCHMLDQ